MQLSSSVNNIIFVGVVVGVQFATNTYLGWRIGNIEIVQKNNQVSVENQAKALTERLDKEIIRPLVAEEVAKTKSNDISKLSNVVNKLADNPEIISALKDTDLLATVKTFQENKEQIKEVAKLTSILGSTTDYQALLKSIGDKYEKQFADTQEKNRLRDLEVEKAIQNQKDTLLTFNNILGKTADRDLVTNLSNSLYTLQSKIDTNNATLLSLTSLVTAHEAFKTASKGFLLCKTNNDPVDSNYLTIATDLNDRYLLPSSTGGTTGDWKTALPTSARLDTTLAVSGNHEHTLTLETSPGFSGYGFLTGNTVVNFSRNYIDSAGGHTHQATTTATGFDFYTDVNHTTVVCYRIN